ncbi:MAG: ABC transporter permease [Flavihumibacter sp.]
MSQPYSQFRAMLAITRASLQAMFRSPNAILFSIFFPLIFILVFGFIGNNGAPGFSIAMNKNADTANAVYQGLRSAPNIRFVAEKDSATLAADLVKGRITGEVDIRPNTDSAVHARYLVYFRATTASADKYAIFLPMLENVINRIDKSLLVNQPTIAATKTDIQEVREYRNIDFILPGQLGFSLLSMGVFGVAFLFFNLRQQLVIKRMFATPVSKTSIVVGEGISRVIFQLITAIIIVALGHYAFKFTLVHGLLTFAEILVLSFIALLVFMGFGFIVSGLAKNDSSIPPLANLITMPQFLLAGTFFSISAFPAWLQPICRLLPLTFFNDAMRKIAFEGAHLTDCWPQIFSLLGWGVVIYAAAIKIFRWE